MKCHTVIVKLESMGYVTALVKARDKYDAEKRTHKILSMFYGEREMKVIAFYENELNPASEEVTWDRKPYSAEMVREFNERWDLAQKRLEELKGLESANPS